MAPFSVTAPQVSTDQESLERERMKPEERQTLVEDLYGGNRQNETEAMRIFAASMLRQALIVIPSELKSAYLEAIEKVPELVKRETPALAFMRKENFDADAAALRIVEYWKIRKQLFGKDKAFLPMTQDGAMQDERTILEKGVVNILPQDKYQRLVVAWDRVRLSRPFASRESCLRLVFYICHVVAESEKAQTHGVVNLINFQGFDFSKHFDRSFDKKFIQIFRDAMPLKLCAFHYFTGPGKSVLSMILPTLKFLWGYHLRHRIISHGGYDQDFVRSLKEYGGLEKNSLSHLFGGDYTHQDYLSWLEKRHSLEQQGQSKEFSRSSSSSLSSSSS